MPHPMTIERIREWCGDIIFARGQSYYKQKRVQRLERDPDSRIFDAVVAGTKKYRVHVEWDGHDRPRARCECPFFAERGMFCKHIAAALLRIRELLMASPQEDAPVITNEHVFLTRKMIALFDRPASGAEREAPLISGEPETVRAEYICTASGAGSPAMNRKPSLTIEIRLGVKRLYVIQNIKALLAHIEDGSPYEITRQFTLDPSVHRFTDTDREILRLLAEIARNEQAYRDSHLMYAFSSYGQSDKVLFVPPFAWDELCPLLLQANVRLVHGGQTHTDIREAEGPLPLRFTFSQPARDVYRLAVEGLEHLTVLEGYRTILEGGRIYRTDPAVCQRIAEMKRMFTRTSGQQVLISPAHLELFLSRVVPGLKRIGPVVIEEELQSRIVTAPLTAKLFLDWQDERLKARLEFAYGEITLDPLAERAHALRPANRILLRDGEKENRVMALIEQIPFHYDGKALHLDRDDDIYHFLHHTLPQLGQWTEVYASPEVERLLTAPPRPPRLSVDLSPESDWLEIRFDMEGIDEAEILEILRHLKEKKKYCKLPGGAFLSLEDDAYAGIGQLIEDMELGGKEPLGIHMRVPVMRGLRLLDPQEDVPGVRLGRRFRELADHIRHPESLEFPVPPSVAPVLRDYQKYGFRWMKTLARYRFGGILADDMGLGKTLQSIAFLASELPQIRAEGKPALIVCPSSLTFNWLHEIGKFAPDIRAAVIEGTKEERDERLGDLSGLDVLITSYPLLRRDAEAYAALEFSVLILDEAQAIKNHATQTAQAAKAIRARHRFALTGTPVENRLEELWSIFDAVFPELFVSRRRFLELSPERVARVIRPFVLRRRKSDVLKELPDKIETVQTSELLKEQKKLYVAYLARLQEEAVRRIREEGFERSRMHILAGLTRLRQLCCHPALFVEGYEGGSGKLEQLVEIVEACRDAGKRLLVFSQFTGMLGIIREELAHLGASFFYLDGQTPGKERVEMCRRFNEGERDLFLISLKAGGTGLNLTGADTVILYDLWWNPAVEEQAADRAHRIGQKNVVHVIRLVSRGTIEEKMLELQQRKRDLIDAVVNSQEDGLASLSEEDIRELLMI